MEFQHVKIMDPVSVIKMDARNALSGFWMQAIITTVVFSILMNFVPEVLDLIARAMDGTLQQTYDFSSSYDIDSTSVADTIEDPTSISGMSVALSMLALVYLIFLSSPLTLGYTSYFLKLHRRMNTEVSNVLNGFRDYSRSLFLLFWLILFGILWSLPMIAAMIVAGTLFISDASLTNMDLLSLMSAFGLLILIICAGMVPIIIAFLRYSQAYYLLLDDGLIRPLDAIRKSKAMMVGNKGKLFLLNLSFIGWWIVVFLALMVVMGFLSIPTFFMTSGGSSAGYIMLGIFMFIVSIFCTSVLSSYIIAANTAFYERVSGRQGQGMGNMRWNAKDQRVPGADYLGSDYGSQSDGRFEERQAENNGEKPPQTNQEKEGD